MKTARLKNSKEAGSKDPICVVGLGYIGLPTATILATQGYQVIGVDIDPLVVEMLQQGDVHIEEPGLRTLVRAAIKSENLVVTNKPRAAGTFIIAVPTPLCGERAELKHVAAAAESLVSVLGKGDLVILESTVPPQTTESFLVPLLERSKLKAGNDFDLAHCPERVLPGKILHELVANDRVIGGITPKSAERAKRIYETFVTGSIYLTDAATAEMVKVVENTFRDVNIALANELSRICSKLGIDVWEVVELANRHPRVRILRPGPGVGGHCLPIDPWFVIEKAPELAKLIRTSRQINDEQPKLVCQLAEAMIRKIRDPRVTILGVTYKANVDDSRESPSLKIIETLQRRGIEIRVHDPHAKRFPFELSPLETALRNSDCAIITVEHDEFVALDPRRLAKLMRTPQVLDTRHCLERSRWEEAGFRVRQLGNGKFKD